MLAADWANLTIAGAFIGGVVVGGVAVMRMSRYIMSWLRREEHDGA